MEISGVNRIPPEVFTSILSYFDLNELQLPSQVCGTWRSFITDYIWRTFEVPLSVLLGILAPLKTAYDKGTIVHLLDVVYSKVDSVRWTRCHHRGQIIKRLRIDCNVHSSSAGLLKRLLSGGLLCPSVVHIQHSVGSVCPPTKHTEIYGLLLSPLLRQLNYRDVNELAPAGVHGRADCVIKKFATACPQIDRHSYHVLHITDCAFVAFMTSLRFLSLHSGISLRTWALLAQECTLLQELEVNPTFNSSYTEGDTSLIISFPSLHTLRLLGLNAAGSLKIMSRHLVLPSIQDLTIQLFRLVQQAAPTFLHTVVARAPDLRRLNLTFGTLLLPSEPWQTLKGLRSLRSLVITRDASFWEDTTDVQGLLEAVPQLQELSLSFPNYDSIGLPDESKLAFTFLCHVPNHCPALRFLRLGIDILEIDDYSGTADGVVFDCLEELHLHLTGTAPQAKYESFITELARMCPHVRIVALVPVIGMQEPPLSSSDMEAMFYACQARRRVV